eukprot:TRINITY_DN2466_c0_g3_i1.p1 TRINITY_DN2466_c0_g3~~TRINITY_DN2466_c0_g3_i1.p1  ORF type:complete len:455 (+),score=86.70 TRINITY_DN2466_c0_g3_i1:75-1439(+)
MGTVCDSSVYEYLLNQPLVQLGVLIGLDSDYVLSFCPTPTVEGEVAKDINDLLLQKIDVYWFVEHAEQVSRMLVGGVSLVGLYLICKEEKWEWCLSNTKNYFSRLKNLSPHISDFILILACPDTKKVYHAKITPDKPVEKINLQPIKQYNVLSDLISFECSIAVDFVFPIQGLTRSRFSEKQFNARKVIDENFDSVVNPFFSKLIEVDGKIVNHTDSISFLDTQNIHTVDFYISSDSSLSNYSEKEVLFKSSGFTRSRAFLGKNSIFSDVFNALKRDMIFSFKARIDVLCEELDRTKKPNLFRNYDALSSRQIIELPKRVFLPFTGPLCLCDYVFPNENARDIVSRSSELFSNLKIDVQKILLDGAEIFNSGLADNNKKSDEKNTASSSKKSEKAKSSTSGNIINTNNNAQAREELRKLSTEQGRIRGSHDNIFIFTIVFGIIAVLVVIVGMYR